MISGRFLFGDFGQVLIVVAAAAALPGGRHTPTTSKWHGKPKGRQTEQKLQRILRLSTPPIVLLLHTSECVKLAHRW